MAWVTPRTWVEGEVITAALLNAQIRDNFLVASTHAHGGGAGDGNDQLDGMDSINFDHIATPSAPGAGKLLLYTDTGGLFFRDGAAGPETKLSDVFHDHTFVAEGEVSGVRFGGGVAGSSWDYIDNSDNDHTITVVTTESSRIWAGMGSFARNDTDDHELYIDAVKISETLNSKQSALRASANKTSSGSYAVRGLTGTTGGESLIGIGAGAVII